jgi:hypothetical protein
MKEIFAIGTLVVIGVIVADVLTHPKGVAAGGTVLNGILTTSFASILGSIPNGKGGYTAVSGG